MTTDRASSRIAPLVSSCRSDRVATFRTVPTIAPSSFRVGRLTRA
ncbi:MAG TPA: hypothetical protein VIE44_19960 [Methylomirabilota bacterium]